MSKKQPAKAEAKKTPAKATVKAKAEPKAKKEPKAKAEPKAKKVTVYSIISALLLERQHTTNEIADKVFAQLPDCGRTRASVVGQVGTRRSILNAAHAEWTEKERLVPLTRNEAGELVAKADMPKKERKTKAQSREEGLAEIGAAFGGTTKKVIPNPTIKVTKLTPTKLVKGKKA